MARTSLSMPDYLSETRHAVAALLPAIWSERETLADLQTRLEALNKEVASEFNAAQAIALNAEDADDVMLATGRHWDTYFGPDKQRSNVAQEVDRISDLVTLHEFSVANLSGALLQTAKQGLNMVLGGKPNPAIGRPVASQKLSEVIWQGRNHALHWEEGSAHPPVTACFAALIADFGQRFAPYVTKSVASELIETLEWKTPEAFETDMLTLVDTTTSS